MLFRKERHVNPGHPCADACPPRMGPLLGRLWSLRFYLLLLWIGFAGFSSAEGETPEIRAEMSPQDQVIAVNSTFVVNCTLNRTRPMYHWTSSDLFFALGGERLDDEYTTVLDEYTIQLRKPMREKLRSAFIVCYLRDHLSSSGKMLSVAQTTLTVGEPPVEPRITSCIVHNWTRMVCTFEPDNQLELTGLETTQTVYYSINCNSPSAGRYKCLNVRSCPNMISPKECQLLMSKDIKLKYNVYIWVTASNALDNATAPLWVVPTRNRVMPDKIREHSIDHTESTTIAMRWKSPINSEFSKPLETRILYEISYVSEWGARNVSTVSSSQPDVDFTLGDLVPFTRYDLSIRCIPLNDTRQPVGYYSEAVNFSASTLPSAPGAAPQVTPGAFFTKDTAFNKRRVDVFWKPIPQPLKYGKLLCFRLRYRPVGTVPMAVHIIHEASAVTANITLSRDQAYEVFIDAATSEGYNQNLSVTPLIIPAEDNVLPGPEEIMAIGKDHSIFMNWTASFNASSHTVFWCQYANAVKCKETLNWVILPSGASNYQIHSDEEFTDLHVGIASQYSDSTSALHWSDCINPMDREVQPPDNLRPTDKQQPNSLMLEWMPLKCHNTAYFRHYIIAYCSTNSQCSDEANWKEEIVRKNETSHTISRLQGDHKYKIRIKSASYGSSSNYTHPALVLTVKRSGLTQWQMALVIIACLILSAFILIGVVTIFRKCKKKFRGYASLKITRIRQQAAQNRPVEHNGHPLQETTEEPVRPSNYFRVDSSGQTDLQNVQNYLMENGKVVLNGTAGTDVSFSNTGPVPPTSNGNGPSHGEGDSLLPANGHSTSCPAPEHADSEKGSATPPAPQTPISPYSTMDEILQFSNSPKTSTSMDEEDRKRGEEVLNEVVKEAVAPTASVEEGGICQYSQMHVDQAEGRPPLRTSSKEKLILSSASSSAGSNPHNWNNANNNKAPVTPCAAAGVVSSSAAPSLCSSTCSSACDSSVNSSQDQFGVSAAPPRELSSGYVSHDTMT